VYNHAQCTKKDRDNSVVKGTCLVIDAQLMVSSELCPVSCVLGKLVVVLRCGVAKFMVVVVVFLKGYSGRGGT